MSSTSKNHDRLLEQAAALHDRILSFDSHIDLPEGFGEAGMRADEDGPGQFDLVKAKRGRLSGAALVVHAGAARPTPEALAAGRAELERAYVRITDIARSYPDLAGIARTPAEFRTLARDGKFAIV